MVNNILISRESIKELLDNLYETTKFKYLNSSMLYVVRYWLNLGKPIADVERLAFVAAIYDFQMRVETLKRNFLSILKYLEKEGLLFSDLSDPRISSIVCERVVRKNVGFFHRFDPKMSAFPLIVRAASSGLKDVAMAHVRKYGVESLPSALLRRAWEAISEALELPYEVVIRAKRSDSDPLGSVACILPKPDSKSVMKRLHLFLRWVARREEPDLGIWGFIPSGKLVVPLDNSIARSLGRIIDGEELRKNYSGLRKAMKFLRTINPDDPVKYDFPLSRPAILGWCKKSLQESDCDICYLNTICKGAKLWKNLARSRTDRKHESKEHAIAKELLKQRIRNMHREINCWTEKTIDHYLRPDVYCENSEVIVGEVKVLNKLPRRYESLEGPDQLVRYLKCLMSEGKCVTTAYLAYAISNKVKSYQIQQLKSMIEDKLYYGLINVDPKPTIELILIKKKGESYQKINA